MNLILWRHAEAEDGPVDLKRALTGRGRKQAERMARWLREHLPDRFEVLASPAVRTCETADALGVEYRTDRRLLPDSDVAHHLAAIEWPEGSAKARGTLPGAVNLDSDLYFELGSAVLLDKASLAAEADAAHAAPGQTVVTFCNAGHWSATDWFVRSELLGEKNVKLYPGSIIDWSQASEPLPMANEPPRLDKLRHMLATWAQRNLTFKTP